LPRKGIIIKANNKLTNNDRMTPHFDHFHDHLTWQQKVDLIFFF